MPSGMVMMLLFVVCVNGTHTGTGTHAQAQERTEDGPVELRRVLAGELLIAQRVELVGPHLLLLA